MSDEEDFDLDELINSHSVRGNPQNDKKISEYESENGIQTDNEEEKSGESCDDSIEDYEIEEIKLQQTTIASSNENENEVNITPKYNKIDSLSDFAQIVLSEIEDRGLPPTPENYEIYFQELLQAQNNDFQDKVCSIIDKEGSKKEIEQKREIEATLQRSIKLIQKLLELTSKVHGNITIMKNIAHKRDKELNEKNSKDIVRLLKFDLGKLESILERQSESMKNLYGRTASTVNKIHEKTIFDKDFEVYNRRYFLESLNHEIEKMNYFQHSSSIALIIPHRKLTAKYLPQKIASIILKTIAKILMESFKRNDIVAYYGHNIFAVLVTHSTTQETGEKIKRFAKVLKNRPIFISDKEIKVSVKVGISELSPEVTVKESLIKALDALKKANRNEKSLYEVID